MEKVLVQLSSKGNHLIVKCRVIVPEAENRSFLQVCDKERSESASNNFIISLHIGSGKRTIDGADLEKFSIIEKYSVRANWASNWFEFNSPIVFSILSQVSWLIVICDLFAILHSYISPTKKVRGTGA